MGVFFFKPVQGNDIRNPSNGQKWKAKVKNGRIKLTGSHNKNLQNFDDPQTLEHCLYIVTNKPGVDFDNTVKTLRLYIHEDDANFKHDMFIVNPNTQKGVPVLCAGHLTLSKKGRIKKMDTDSGHYQPSLDNLKLVIGYFKGANIFSKNCQACHLRNGQCLNINAIKAIEFDGN